VAKDNDLVVGARDKRDGKGNRKGKGVEKLMGEKRKASKNEWGEEDVWVVDPWTGTHPRDAFAGHYMIDGMEKPHGEFWQYFLNFHKDSIFHYNGKTYTFKDFIDLNIEALRKEAKEYIASNIDMKNTMLEFMTTAESGQTYKGAITFTIERLEREEKYEFMDEGIIEMGEKDEL